MSQTLFDVELLGDNDQRGQPPLKLRVWRTKCDLYSSVKEAAKAMTELQQESGTLPLTL